MFLGSREAGSWKGGFGRIPGFCRPGDTKDWRGPRKKEAQEWMESWEARHILFSATGKPNFKRAEHPFLWLKTLCDCPLTPGLWSSTDPALPPHLLSSTAWAPVIPEPLPPRGFSRADLFFEPRGCPQAAPTYFFHLLTSQGKGVKKKIWGVLWLKNWLGDVLCMHLLC